MKVKLIETYWTITDQYKEYFWFLLNKTQNLGLHQEVYKHLVNCCLNMCLISVSNKPDLVKHSFISSNLFIYYCITFPLHSINGYLVNSWNLASCQPHMVTAEQNNKEYWIKNNNNKHTHTNIWPLPSAVKVESGDYLRLCTKFRTGQSEQPSLYQV